MNWLNDEKNYQRTMSAAVAIAFLLAIVASRFPEWTLLFGAASAAVSFVAFAIYLAVPLHEERLSTVIRHQSIADDHVVQISDKVDKLREKVREMDRVVLNDRESEIAHSKQLIKEIQDITQRALAARTHAESEQFIRSITTFQKQYEHFAALSSLSTSYTDVMKAAISPSVRQRYRVFPSRSEALKALAETDNAQLGTFRARDRDAMRQPDAVSTSSEQATGRVRMRIGSVTLEIDDIEDAEFSMLDKTRNVRFVSSIAERKSLRKEPLQEDKSVGIVKSENLALGSEDTNNRTIH